VSCNRDDCIKLKKCKSFQLRLHTSFEITSRSSGMIDILRTRAPRVNNRRTRKCELVSCVWPFRISSPITMTPTAGWPLLISGLAMSPAADTALVNSLGIGDKHVATILDRRIAANRNIIRNRKLTKQKKWKWDQSRKADGKAGPIYLFYFRFCVRSCMARMFHK